MSDAISFRPTDADKRAEVFRRLADAESDASRAARQLDTYERMVINQRDAVAQADELCNSLRKECAALLSHLDGAAAPAEPQAPAQPLDELRSVPGAEEKVRDQIDASKIPDGYKLIEPLGARCQCSGPDALLEWTDGLGGYYCSGACNATISERSADSLLTAFKDDHIVSRGPLIDAQTCDEVDPRVRWDGNQFHARTDVAEPWTAQFAVAEPDAVETDQPEVRDVEETLPGDPLPGFDEADAESDALGDGWIHWTGGDCPVDQSAVVEYRLRGADSPPRDPKPAFLLRWDHAGVLGDIIAYRVVSQPADQHEDPTAVAIAAYIEAENPEPTSVLDDPELQAAVDRANASIAQDEPVYTEREIAKHEAAANFWGTALTGGNSHPQDNAKKPFFGFMAAKPKPETEPA